MIKLLVEEEGSDLADEIWERAAWRISSVLVYVEGRAALAAACRAGRLDEPAAKSAAAQLQDACNSMQLIETDGSLIESAGNLAERRALRGYDAIHLATALTVTDPDLVIVTWDRDLADAALAEGRHTAGVCPD